MTLTEKLREIREIQKTALECDDIKEWYEGLSASDSVLLETARKELNTLLDIIEVQREALKMVIAQSGLPDPSDACRAAIKTAKEALEKAESMVRG